MQDVEIFKASVMSAANGSTRSRVHCPACSPERKKSGERTLSVTVDDGFALFKCHHCDASGRVETGDGWTPPAPTHIQATKNPSVPIGDLASLDSLQVQYLSSRGISQETAERCGVVSGMVWMRDRGKEVRCIGFPYSNDDGSTAIKWRDGAKNFSQTGAARSLWRISEFTGGDLVICEGELDACSFEECGIQATSVPNGAPLGEVKSGTGKKFSYLWDAKDVIERADRIILATDRDAPGDALAEEIARRVGKARCWRVPFPDGCKDANDVLVKKGKDALLSTMELATPWPVMGLRDASEYRSEAVALYKGDFDSGISSGLHDLDRLYKVMPQTLTIITGVPGSGKSTFLTWMSVNIASKSNWNCAILSSETSSQVHVLQMASVYIGKPFRGPNKMSESELMRGLDWVESQFVFLDESDTDIQSVLDRAHAAILRNGVRLLIIDPYNFLTGEFVDGTVQGINTLLVSLKSFAIEHGIAVWLVAHPTKMYRQSDGKVPTPGGYDISGSASFFNVADAGLSIGRDSPGKTLVTCWKVRFPWIGDTGQALLDFSERDGSFSSTNFGGDIFAEESAEDIFDTIGSVD
jgi:twinkle protein